MNILIPMAGAGSRFSKVGEKTPKPLIQVLGKTLIEYPDLEFYMPDFIYGMCSDYLADINK